MRETRLAAAVSVLAIAAVIASCVDNGVAPEGEPIVPFAIGDQQRAMLGAALRFAARDESLSERADREARTRLIAAFTLVADRVAQNDRGGARRAIGVARAALRLYSERAGSDLGALLELEALSLSLDHAELLAADAPTPLYQAAEADGS